MSYVTDDIDETVIGLLKEGGVGLLPSDTIYGLSCVALKQASVERLRQIKNRDKTKPFVILISKIEQLGELGIEATAAAPAWPYWPAKLTLICEAKKAPKWLHMGTASLAVRQPDNPTLRQLIDTVGPIISTSANLAGGQPAQSCRQASDCFGDKLDFYVDVGPLKAATSTIIKKDNDRLKIVRPGAVKIDDRESR